MLQKEIRSPEFYSNLLWLALWLWVNYLSLISLSAKQRYQSNILSSFKSLLIFIITCTNDNIYLPSSYKLGGKTSSWKETVSILDYNLKNTVTFSSVILPLLKDTESLERNWVPFFLSFFFFFGFSLLSF